MAKTAQTEAKSAGKPPAKDAEVSKLVARQAHTTQQMEKALKKLKAKAAGSSERERRKVEKKLKELKAEARQHRKDAAKRTSKAGKKATAAYQSTVTGLVDRQANTMVKAEKLLKKLRAEAEQAKARQKAKRKKAKAKRAAAKAGKK